MTNLVLRVRYILMKRWNITPKLHRNPDIEYHYTDDFRSLWHWVPTQPETVQTSRRSGLTLTLKQIDKKSFISPCIIHKSNVTGGIFKATATINQHEKLIHYFLFRRKEIEMGFKVNQNRVYVIFPHESPVKFKLYQPEQEHSFEVEVDPIGLIYWRVDNILVYQKTFPSLEPKHIMIGVSAAQQKINPKDLPLSFKLKEVQIFHNHLHELKRTEEE